MYGKNCSYTSLSYGEVRNFPRSRSSRIRAARNSAACRLMLHSCIICSGSYALHPQSTQAGASNRDANIFAACSIGLSRAEGSLLTSPSLPTCPRIMCPSSCAAVKRRRPKCSIPEDIYTVYLPFICSVYPSSPGPSYSFTLIPRRLHIGTTATGSSLIPLSIKNFQTASREFL